MRATKLLLLLLTLCLALTLGTALADDSPATGTDIEPEEPEVTTLNVRPSASAATYSGGVWTISVTESTTTVGFKWKSVTNATTYKITVKPSGDGDSLSYSQKTTTLKISLEKLTVGETYTITVTAYNKKSKKLTSDKLTFILKLKEESEDPDEPEGGDDDDDDDDDDDPDQPDFPGGRPGGRRGGSGGGGMTPGTALTSTHSSGNKDMSLYGTVDLTVTEEEMNTLKVDDTELGVTLDGGASAFTADVSAADGVLYLTPVADGSSWQLSGAALKKLNRSGVTTVNLLLNGVELTMDTEITLSGTAYTELRVQGFTDSTFLWTVDAAGLHCQADGVSYLYQDGILTREV